MDSKIDLEPRGKKITIKYGLSGADNVAPVTQAVLKNARNFYQDFRKL